MAMGEYIPIPEREPGDSRLEKLVAKFISEGKMSPKMLEEYASLLDFERGVVRDFIDYDQNGLDDVALNNVHLFRMERMDDNAFWIRCYRKGGQDIVFRLHAIGDRLTVVHEVENNE